MGYPDGKEPGCQCRRLRFHPWVGKIPWRRKRQPTPVFLPGKSHGQRSLGGYGPWGCRESDRTERLNTNVCRWPRPLTLPLCSGPGSLSLSSAPIAAGQFSIVGTALCTAESLAASPVGSHMPAASLLPLSYETYCFEPNPTNKSIFSELHVLP